MRATELSRLSGRHKQVIGMLIDELEHLGYVERRPDPADRRATLVSPTPRGQAETRILTTIQERHARRLGRETWAVFNAALIDVTRHQRNRPR